MALRFRLGTKLAVMSGFGMLLVVGLIGANAFFAANNEALGVRADTQALIGQTVLEAKVSLRETQMAARDMNLATSPAAAEDAYAAQQSRFAEMVERLERAKSQMTTAENIARIDAAIASGATYLEVSGKLLPIIKRKMALPPGNVDLSVVKSLEEVRGTMQQASSHMLAAFDETIAGTRQVEAEVDQYVRTQAQLALLSSLVFGLLTILAMLGTAIFGARSIARPIRQITARMSALAGNELDAAIPYLGRTDEIGDMAAAVQVFRQNAIEVSELNQAERIRTGQTRERAAAMAALVTELGQVVDAAVLGDFSHRITKSFADADLVGVAASVNALVDTVDRGLTETGAVLSALARTDLTMRVAGDYSGAFAKLRDDTNAVVDNLTHVVGQLRQTSGSLKTATGDILAGANDLAERTTRQAAAIEETSAAMEQLAGTVTDNARRADQASTKARTVSTTAEQTGQVMTRSNAAMERISSSSAKISNIIGLIDDIAFQTNLLALNASVEAARAGDAGKGFAVVAVEVRRLAQSAASASSEVKELIEQSAGEVVSGSRLVAEATQMLEAMLGDVRESALLTQDISEATRAQSNAIGEVTAAIRQMDEMTQHNAALVEETNAAIEQTESQAIELDRIVDVFVLDARRPRRQPASAGTAPPSGARALQARVRGAADSYLTGGNTALQSDWDAF